MNIRVYKNKEELYQDAANFFLFNINDNKKIVLGLATGSTPVPLYKLLVKDYNENHTDYSNVKSFNLDEYVGLPKDHKETYFNFMNENLFKHINIKDTNLPDGDPSKLEESCKSYEKLLDQNTIDIQLLGLGSNGHIGFNEPGTPFDSGTHIVELAEKTRQDNARFFNSIDEVPKQAITMGINSIMKAKSIFLIATGEQKADAVYQMVKGEVDEKCPASILQNHENCYIFLDEAAASKLDL